MLNRVDSHPFCTRRGNKEEKLYFSDKRLKDATVLNDHGLDQDDTFANVFHRRSLVTTAKDVGAKDLGDVAGEHLVVPGVVRNPT